MYYSLSFHGVMPWCIYFGQYRQNNHWEHSGKKIPFHLLVYVTSGSAVFDFSDHSYEMHAGDCLLIPGDTFYTAYTTGYCEYYYFHFTAKLTQCDETLLENKSNWGFGYLAEPTDSNVELTSVCCLAEWLHFPEHSTVMLPLCVKMHHLLHKLQPEAEFEFQLIFGQILLELSKLLRNNISTSTSAVMNKIVYHIHKNATKSISLNDIAEHFGLSKSYILKLFHQILLLVEIYLV